MPRLFLPVSQVLDDRLLLGMLPCCALTKAGDSLWDLAVTGLAASEHLCIMQMPYAQLRENNWTLFLDFKGYIGARYDL